MQSQPRWCILQEMGINDDRKKGRKEGRRRIFFVFFFQRPINSLAAIGAIAVGLLLHLLVFLSHVVFWPKLPCRENPRHLHRVLR